MSLRSIHVLFIAASIALALFMGLWGIAMFRSPAGSGGHLATGLVALLAGAGLTAYAVAFVRKTRRIGID